MARDKAQLLEMGARIKELRETHGFKQQWIADQVGVSLRTFQFWQAGKSPPEQENLERLAALFGVTPKYILKGDTPDLLPPGDYAAQLDRIESRLDEIADAAREFVAFREEVRDRYGSIDSIVRRMYTAWSGQPVRDATVKDAREFLDWIAEPGSEPQSPPAEGRRRRAG